MKRPIVRTVYCTSYCNKLHYIENGRPIDHECYVLPSDMLEAEKRGDYEGALAALIEKGRGPLVRGRKPDSKRKVR
jgi:hypothetical protein